MTEPFPDPYEHPFVLEPSVDVAKAPVYRYLLTDGLVDWGTRQWELRKAQGRKVEDLVPPNTLPPKP